MTTVEFITVEQRIAICDKKYADYPHMWEWSVSTIEIEECSSLDYLLDLDVPIQIAKNQLVAEIEYRIKKRVSYPLDYFDHDYDM